MVGIAIVKAEDEVLLVTDQGQMLRIKATDIRETGRNAQGVRLMTVAEDERIVGAEVVDPGPAPDPNASNPPPSSPPDSSGNLEAGSLEGGALESAPPVSGEPADPDAEADEAPEES